jgi:hypothetical protein
MQLARLLAAALALSAGGLPDPTAALSASPATSLRQIRITGPAVSPVIVIEADGPLPIPIVGEAANPPRLFLDLANVRTSGTTVPAPDGGLAIRVRAAQHSASPLSARIVIDLDAAAVYKLEQTARTSGRISVSLARRDDRQPLDARGRSAGGRGAASRTPERARRNPSGPADRYLRAVSPLVSAMESLRDVLQAIDRRTAVDADRAAEAADLLPGTAAGLDALHPPGDLANAHDLLRSACAMASTALAQVQAAQGQPIPWNASSAAAGALIMLERAEAALKRPSVSRPEL